MPVSLGKSSIMECHIEVRVQFRAANLELHISHFKSSLSEYFNLSNLHVLFLVLVPRNLSKIHKILAPPDTKTETAFEPFHDG